MESAILTWVVTVGLPVAAFFISIINKTKESERRITLVEEKQKNLEKRLKNMQQNLP